MVDDAIIMKGIWNLQEERAHRRKKSKSCPHAHAMMMKNAGSDLFVSEEKEKENKID